MLGCTRKNKRNRKTTSEKTSDNLTVNHHTHFSATPCKRQHRREKFPPRDHPPRSTSRQPSTGGRAITVATHTALVNKEGRHIPHGLPTCIEALLQSRRPLQLLSTTFLYTPTNILRHYSKRRHSSHRSGRQLRASTKATVLPAAPIVRSGRRQFYNMVIKLVITKG